jgi:hypothetical protein
MTREEFIVAAFGELRRIESGQATVHMIEGDVLIGKVRYRTSDGWTVVVFSDGDAWDYIDSMTAPSGAQFPLWPDNPVQDSEGLAQLRTYHPPGNQATTIWGFMA